MKFLKKCFFILNTLLLLCTCDRKDSNVSGEHKKWHRVTLTFEGPETSENDDYNPFLNYKLQAIFKNGDKSYTIPGFYAADGIAGESGAESGNKWKVHFTPDETGVWKWEVSFRQGDSIAVKDNPDAGEPVYFDGTTGIFEIEPSDKKGRDFRSTGKLIYSPEGYLKFAESGEYWIKNGTNSPENFLAYHDFDGTWDEGGVEIPTLEKGLHKYVPHINDWKEDDPVWDGNKGKGIIGALNYLSSKGINSLYFIVMNVAGDGQDVWPWTGPDNQTRFDVSKLAQWEIVFSHMDSLGILLHVLTQERENDTLLNSGQLGVERKLYYRELISRFAHHPGLIWNLGEETTRTTEQLKSYASFFKEQDPYGHFTCVHTNIRGSHEDEAIDPHELVYRPLLGFSQLDGVSLQIGNIDHVHDDVIKWIRESKKSGHRWVVNLDEIGHWSVGVTTDGENNNHELVRDKALWGSFLAGAGGVEWYFGWDNNGPDSDLSSENFRSRNDWFEYSTYAFNFFKDYLPFWEMQSADILVDNSESYCFAKPGEIYAIYLPKGSPTKVNLTDQQDKFQVHWYNPRTGGGLLKGSGIGVKGGHWEFIGDPPYESELDWVVLIRKKK